MPRFQDDAIVIRESDWSETSQVVTLLTAAHGKVRGLAKGTKRMTPSSVARFSGGIEPLTRGQIVGTLKPITGLANLTEWDLVEPYFHLRTNLVAMHLALYAADVANAMLADHDAHPGTFAAMAELLPALATENERERAMLLFQWRLLTDGGLWPELEKDVHSGAQLPAKGTLVFDPHGGGLTSGILGAGDARGWKVRGETVALLRGLVAGNGAVGAPVEALRRANRLLCSYLRAVLDRELPTMAFILSTGEGRTR
ncbi:MAG: DNA repair protein RecO [Phycisphaeraceae bacterium]